MLQEAKQNEKHEKQIEMITKHASAAIDMLKGPLTGLSSALRQREEDSTLDEYMRSSAGLLVQRAQTMMQDATDLMIQRGAVLGRPLDMKEVRTICSEMIGKTRTY